MAESHLVDALEPPIAKAQALESTVPDPPTKLPGMTIAGIGA